MKVQVLNKDNLQSFLDYCSSYGDEHDQSFLLSVDMDGQDFTDVKTNPTVILLDGEEVVGAFSLMTYMNFSEELTKYRVRIMHSILKSEESYQLLWDAMSELNVSYDQIYLFIPDNEKTSHMDAVLKMLGFKVERKSFVLMNREEGRKEVILPEGYKIRPLDTESELDKYAEVRNISFKNLLVARAKVGADFLPYIQSEYFIEDSMMFLIKENQVAGFLAVGPDEDDSPNEAGIGGIGLLPEYRGKGLGKALLRHGVNFLKDKGFTDIWLSVNGENEDAVRLYVKEGFVKEEALTCYLYEH